MVGIIYKFTTLTNNRYYVGQRQDTSLEHFLQNSPSNYWGSGTIWADVLNSIKKEYPDNWWNMIKREVLCYITKKDYKLLNKLEKFWIEKERAHVSENLGGCNYLRGAAYGDDWVNSMADPEIRAKATAKIAPKNRERMSHPENHPMRGKHHTEEAREKIRQARLGKKLSKQTKEKISKTHKGRLKTEEWKKKIGDAQRGEKSVHYGKKLSEEHRMKVSEGLKNSKTLKDSLKDRIWITNGVVDKRIKKNQSIPEGWQRGRTNW